MNDDLVRARHHLIEALGKQSAFWGLGKTAGEIYAVLYLSEHPLSLQELAASLGVTKGNISIAIRSLEQLGMVSRSQKPGDRRVFFAAEPDFWLIARRVLERRQKPEFDGSFRLVEHSLSLAERSQPGRERDFILQRLKSLKHFYDELDQVVETILVLEPRRLSGLVRTAARFLKRKNAQKG